MGCSWWSKISLHFNGSNDLITDPYFVCRRICCSRLVMRMIFARLLLNYLILDAKRFWCLQPWPLPMIWSNWSIWCFITLYVISPPSLLWSSSHHFPCRRFWNWKMQNKGKRNDWNNISWIVLKMTSSLLLLSYSAFEWYAQNSSRNAKNSITHDVFVV